MLKDYLCHISNTIFGSYQQPFSKEWDKTLNQLLDEGECFFAEEHAAAFWYEGNIYSVWIENRWYSYANLHQFNEQYIPVATHTRPRFSTMRRLHRFICELHQGDAP